MPNPSELRALADEAASVVVIAHIAPDGDTIGSALGLAWALRQLGKRARVACADPSPRELAFLPGVGDISAEPPEDEDLIIVVDASDVERIGSLYDAQVFATRPVVNIDHHITNQRYGTLNLVTQRSSTAELILDQLTDLGVTLDLTIATCLLTGLVTDTRGFTTSNTTPASLEAAVVLTRAGALLPAINDAVFNHRSITLLRLWGAAFVATRLEEEGVLWTELPLTMLAQAGADLADAKGLVNFLSSIDEARISATFRETPEGKVDVSLRSVPGIDVSQVAMRFGGGGHPQAAGCLVPGTLGDVRSRIVQALREAARQDRGPAPGPGVG
jgi:phosphoesterase RecJ-like protein